MRLVTSAPAFNKAVWIVLKMRLAQENHRFIAHKSNKKL